MGSSETLEEKPQRRDGKKGIEEHLVSIYFEFSFVRGKKKESGVGSEKA